MPNKIDTRLEIPQVCPAVRNWPRRGGVLSFDADLIRLDCEHTMVQIQTEPSKRVFLSYPLQERTLSKMMYILRYDPVLDPIPEPARREIIHNIAAKILTAFPEHLLPEETKSRLKELSATNSVQTEYTLYKNRLLKGTELEDYEKTQEKKYLRRKARKPKGPETPRGFYKLTDAYNKTRLIPEMSAYQKREFMAFESRFISRIHAAGDKKAMLARLKEKVENYLREGKGFDFRYEHGSWNFFNDTLTDELAKTKTSGFIKEIFKNSDFRYKFLGSNFDFFTGITTLEFIKEDLISSVSVWQEDTVKKTAKSVRDSYFKESPLNQHSRARTRREAARVRLAEAKRAKTMLRVKVKTAEAKPARGAWPAILRALHLIK